MVQCFFRSQPLIRINLNQTHYEILGLVAYFLPISLLELYATARCLFRKFLRVIGSERSVATEKNVGDYTKAGNKK